MIMRFLHQTRGYNCGQACLSMLLDLNISRAEQLMQTTGCTSTKQMREAIKRFGGRSTGPTVRVGSTTPDSWIIRNKTLLLFIKNCPGVKAANHWALWDGHAGVVLDPALRFKVGGKIFQKMLLDSEARVTSYLEIG
jgi:hypothetical protein